MGNPSYGSQAAGAPGGARGANQALVVLFERDESLAASLIGQLRGQGYECRPARTPVEVFDSIARYPVGLVLVNLGQPATSRREFWVALDAQRRGRGVQVITYRIRVPGAAPDVSEGNGHSTLADVEIRGTQDSGALIEAVRQRLPLRPRQSPDSSFLLGEEPPARGAFNGQSGPAGPAASPGIPPSGPDATGYVARPQIAGVLNMNAGMPVSQLPEFAPLPGSPPAGPVQGGWMPAPGPVQGGWMPAGNQMPPPGGPPPTPLEQRAQQWLGSYQESPAPPPQASAQGNPGAPMRQDMPGNAAMSRAGGVAGQAGEVPSREQVAPSPFNAAMPMGELTALSDAVHALAAAGAPGYHQAAAAANAMNLANMSGSPVYGPGMPSGPVNLANGPGSPMNGAGVYGNPMNGPGIPGSGPATYWPTEQRHPSQETPTIGARGAVSVNPYGPPMDMSAGRQPATTPGAMSQMGSGPQAPARGVADTLSPGQQPFAEVRKAAEVSRPQQARSHSFSATSDEEIESAQRVRTTPAGWGHADDPPTSGARRISGQVAPALVGTQVAAYHQHQAFAPVVAPGRVERSLSNVLVEGQLVSQQRLEVALGIQRLLRGVDIDYRLGELLLIFKFLTSDQLLAALLVSRGLVTPAQVASMGRIKQELHAIGMEYDLENLLILFRLLTSEQLREIRSEFP